MSAHQAFITTVTVVVSQIDILCPPHILYPSARQNSGPPLQLPSHHTGTPSCLVKWEKDGAQWQCWIMVWTEIGDIVRRALTQTMG